MKKKTCLLLPVTLLFCALMLFFTFFTFAWFSDAHGFEWGFEIPVGYSSGPLSTLADVFWMLSPFCLIISAVWGDFEKGEKRLSLLASTLPLTLYALLRLLLLAFGQESHGTILITLGCVILLGLAGFVGAFYPEARRIGAWIALSYVALECLLLVLSVFLETKLSFFYFFQWIPLGHTSRFSYSFIAISSFLYYLTYGLALFLRFLPHRETKTPPSPPTPEEKTEEDNENEEDEEDLSSLTLEDLGISR